MYVFQAAVDETLERITKFRLSRNNMLTMYTDDPSVILYVEFVFDCLPELAVKLGRTTPTVSDGTLSFAFCLEGPSPPDASVTIQLWVGTRKARVLLAMSVLVVRAKLEMLSARQRLDTAYEPQQTRMRAFDPVDAHKPLRTKLRAFHPIVRVDKQPAPWMRAFAPVDKQPSTHEPLQTRMRAFDPVMRIDEQLAYSWLEPFVQ
jgi:hypothetical protein